MSNTKSNESYKVEEHFPFKAGDRVWYIEEKVHNIHELILGTVRDFSDYSCVIDFNDSVESFDIHDIKQLRELDYIFNQKIIKKTDRGYEIEGPENMSPNVKMFLDLPLSSDEVKSLKDQKIELLSNLLSIAKDEMDSLKEKDSLDSSDLIKARICIDEIPKLFKQLGALVEMEGINE